MQATASQYLKKHNTMDLSVIASYGFSDDDKEELDSIKNADVEYGYLTDVTVKNTDDAIRVFSKAQAFLPTNLYQEGFQNHLTKLRLLQR